MLLEKINKLSIKAEDKTQILEEWSKAPKRYCIKNCVHQWFEQRVLIDPDKSALNLNNTILSYAELNSRANKMANYLLSLGINQETIIGVQLPRRQELFVAMLAIMKAGATFLPVDLEYPDERCQLILSLASADFLICCDDSIMNLNEEIKKINIFHLQDKINKYDHINLNLRIKPDHLAYIIFTSGTSGQPKGVMIEHGSFSNLAQAQVDLFKIEPSTNILQFASPSFDACISEWSTALISGATLFLIEPGTSSVVENLITVINSHSIDLVTLPPSLLNSVNPSDVKSLKTVVVAGEACSEYVMNLWKNHVTLINAYGPTEATVCATTHIFDENDLSTNIGQPISGVEIYLLDVELQPVPIGIIGEIYIGGIGLARGYIGNASLTDERFKLIDINQKTLRLYKSGDLGKWLPEGNIEFSARSDFQVKINGYRIEPEEIEKNISKHNSVKAVSVIPFKKQQQSIILIAFIIFKPNSNNSIAKVQDFLSQYLPKYMLPKLFIPLEIFPLTTNGKVDRTRLIKIYEKKLSQDNENIIKTTFNSLLEEKIAKIWCEVLDISHVNRLDDFFEIGGDSIAAIKFITACREIGIEVEINKIFSFPVLLELAKIIEEQCGKVIENSMLTIQSMPKNIDYIPLSSPQKQLWKVDRYIKDKSIYNTVRCLRFKGVLDITSLNKAIQFLVARHEILRTRIIFDKDKLYQKITSALNHDVVHLDLSFLSNAGEEEKKLKIRSLAIKNLSEPFDLAQPPLFNIQVVQFNPESTALILVLHHILADAWSIDLFFRELTLCYNAFVSDQSPKLTPLKIQYKDFAYSQQQWKLSSIFQNQKEFWLKTLKGLQAFPPLLVSNQQKSTNSFKGKIFKATIGSPLTEEITHRISQLRITPLMLFLALFKIVCFRLNKVSDITIGVPSSQRHYNDTETLLGFLINVLPIRNQINGGESIEETIHAVCTSCKKAFENQDYPYDQILEDLSLNTDSLIQMMFSYQDIGKESPDFTGLVTEDLCIAHEYSRFDISITVTKINDIFEFTFEYNTNLYNQCNIERIFNYYISVCQHWINNSDARVDQISLLTEDEMFRWSHFLAKSPAPINLIPAPYLIEETAEIQPDSIAISYLLETLTYKKLNSLSNKIGNFLLKQSFETSSVIAIALPTSINLLPIILAVMKARLVFVLLDSNVPAKRNGPIFKESGAVCLISDSMDLTQEVNQEAICFTTELVLQQSKKNCSNNIRTAIIADDVAYLIYTSGTTGQPKGSVIQHKALTNLVKNEIDLLCIDSSSIVLQFATVTFDAFIWEFSAALCAGAKLQLIDSNKQLIANKKNYRNILESITVATLPPTVASLFDFTDFPNLETLVLAGESFSDALLARWKKYPIRLINAYGLSETTVCASMHCYQEGDAANLIGGPIKNVSIVILDQSKQLVPMGVVGDICVGGMCLANNYVDKCSTSSESFFLWAQDTGKDIQLFKTGDRGYLTEQNILCYVGRNDNQIKINGNRVELSEVSNVLQENITVAQSYVASKTESGNEKIIAFIKPNTVAANFSKQDHIAQIRAFVNKHLPSYMRPNYYFLIDKLPLTQHGKVDKDKLLQRCSSSRLTEDIKTKNVVEQTKERKLLNILSSLFEKNDLHLADDFYERGGNSLMAIQLVTQLSDEGFEVTVEQVLSNPRFCDLLLMLQTDRTENTEILSYQKSTNSRLQYIDRFLPLSLAQMRLWFTSCLYESNKTLYNVPIAFRISSSVDSSILETAIDTLIKRHLILSCNVKLIDGKPYQKINDTLKISIQTVQCEHTDLINLKIKEITQLPFLLEKELPLKVYRITVSKQKDILAFVFHHFVCDGWSVGIFMKELTTIYNNLFSDNVIAPLVQPSQYFDYIDYEINEKSRYKDNIKNYWHNELKGITLDPLSSLGFNPQDDTNGIRINKNIKGIILEKIKKFSLENNITLAVFFQSIFFLLLYKYTSVKDLVLGCPVANRSKKEFQNTIGFFVNILPVRLNINSNMTGLCLLQAIKKKFNLALNYQDIPFDYLVDQLKEKNSDSQHPIFQILFNYQVNQEKNWSFGTNLLDAIEIDLGHSKYPLSLNVVDNGDIIQCYFEYQSHSFQSNLMDQFSDHFCTLVDTFIDQAHKPIGGYSLLNSQEKNSILSTYNPAIKTSSTYVSVLHMIEEIIIKYPARIALDNGIVQYTYDQLGEKSNQLAHYLISKGLVANDIVLVLAEDGVEAIIAILAVTKVGAVYAPVSLTWSEDRLQNIAKQTQAKFLLIHQKNLESVNWFSKNIIELTALEIGEQPKAHVKVCAEFVANKSLSYIIFTSGTTGKPKGVMISQYALVNYIQHCSKFYNKKINSLLHSSLAFDMSVTTMYLPLVTGGTLFSCQRMAEIGEISSFLTDKRSSINLVKLTPTHLKLLKNILPLIPSDKAIDFIIGGEKLSTKDIMPFYSKLPCSNFYNEYGPTEATVACAIYKISLKDSEKESMPIGKPIANAALYILDQDLNIVPKGTSGELYISGPGLSLGYLNDINSTKNAFVDDPFTQSLTRNMYKTGDVCQYGFDNNIMYISRIKGASEIKYRGYRINLNEIEAIVQSCTLVSSCVVLVDESQDYPVMIAYIVPKDLKINNKSFIEDVKKSGEPLLPKYMQPEVYHLLDGLPVNENGKLDYQKLPTMKKLSQKNLQKELPINIDAPLTDKITHLWETVLNTKSSQLDDNFFDHGGTSFLLSELILKLHNAFDTEISLRAFFQKPTLKYLIMLFHNQHEDKELLQDQIFNDDKISITLNLNEGLNFTENQLPANILLTGVTGFLGAYLLRELCSQTKANIFCLVRNINQKSFLEKHTDYFRKVGLRLEEYVSRINFITADISCEKLGLEKDLYDQLSQQIDCVIHSAALVNHTLDYQHLRKTNVLGTHALIEFSLNKKKKKFHYMSSISDLFQMNSVLSEDFMRNLPVKIHNSVNGYMITKLVSEHMLSRANDLGLNVSIYRLPMLFGASDNGFCATQNNHLLYILKQFINTGIAPEWSNTLDIIPANDIAEILVRNFNSTSLESKVFNVSSGSPLSWEVILHWVQEAGFNLKKLSNEIWQTLMKTTISPADSIYPLIGFYLENNCEDDTPIDFYHINFDDLLSRTDKKTNALQMNRVKFMRVICYLVEIGFIDDNGCAKLRSSMLESSPGHVRELE